MTTYAQDFAKGAAKAREHRARGVVLSKISRLRSEAYHDGYLWAFYEKA